MPFLASSTNAHPNPRGPRSARGCYCHGTPTCSNLHGRISNDHPLECHPSTPIAASPVRTICPRQIPLIPLDVQVLSLRLAFKLKWECLFSNNSPVSCSHFFPFTHSCTVRPSSTRSTNHTIPECFPVTSSSRRSWTPPGSTRICSPIVCKLRTHFRSAAKGSFSMWQFRPPFPDRLQGALQHWLIVAHHNHLSVPQILEVLDDLFRPMGQTFSRKQARNQHLPSSVAGHLDWDSLLFLHVRRETAFCHPWGLSRALQSNAPSTEQQVRHSVAAQWRSLWRPRCL